MARRNARALVGRRVARDGLRRCRGSAQTPAEFYKGKTVELYVNVSVGGGYDLYARMLARHLGKHIPGNPTVVPKNMEGGGGMRLANWLYNVAPKDGTALGAASRAMAFEPLLGNKAAQYDGRKFNWIGSANDEVSVCVAWHTSGIKTFEDAQKKELVVGFERHLRRHLSISRAAQQHVRRQVQDGYRLSGRQRHEPRDGARRDAGPLRHPVVDREGDAQNSGSTSKGQPADAVLARQASRPAGRAAGDGPRQERRAAHHPQADLRPPGDGPPLRGAAGRAARIGSMRCARRSWTPWRTRTFWPRPRRRKFEVTPVSGEKIESLVHEVYAHTTPELAEKAGAAMK